jgi:GDP-4-dehydro-6-deoxy-D-mannose reductase
MLLVGAGGFVGSHLLAAARTAGVRVVPAGRDSSPACDLRDPIAVEACIETVRPDLIVNAAGAASVKESWERPEEVFDLNAAGVAHLLDAASRQVPTAHVLCVSSAEVYESGDGASLLREDLELRPLTPYGKSKVAMEMFCARARERGQKVAVVRVFNLLGPGQRADFAASGFARRIAEAERAGLDEVELALGHPGATRDFTDVRDAARALLELSRRQLGGTYNLCSGVGVTIAELVEGLSQASRLKLTVRQDPDLERPADPPALVGDPTRLRETIGFEPTIGFSQTLSDLLDWWRAELAAA